MVNTSIVEGMKHCMFQSFIFTPCGGIHGQMPHEKKMAFTK